VISNIGGGTGIANFTYLLNGVAIVLPTDNTIKALTAGVYTFSIVDNIGCLRDFAPVVIQFPGFVNSSTPIATAPDCSGAGSNGTITFQITDPGTFQVGYTHDAIVEPTNYFNPGGSFVTITNLGSGNYYIWIKSSGSQCATKLSPVSITGTYPVNFNATAANVLCFGNTSEISLTTIQGAPNLDYAYELVKDGVTSSGAITFAQSLADVKITGLLPGSYQVRLTQNQSSLVTACTTPIASAYQNLSITSPTVALDTLYVNRVISLPDLATGSILVGVKESEQEPYEIRLELIKPIYSDQAFVMDWTETSRNPQNLKMELQVNNLFAGDYQLSVRDGQACVRDYPITLKVDTDIYVPNVFTPNGDGVNDVFFIRNLPENSILIITNRWGNEVYTSGGYQNDWGGGEIADGIYYYRLSLAEESLTGWVEIMRGK
jgi:gliding motility-associated-like protein